MPAPCAGARAYGSSAGPASRMKRRAIDAGQGRHEVIVTIPFRHQLRRPGMGGQWRASKWSAWASNWHDRVSGWGDTPGTCVMEMRSWFRKGGGSMPPRSLGCRAQAEHAMSPGGGMESGGERQHEGSPRRYRAPADSYICNNRCISSSFFLRETRTVLLSHMITFPPSLRRNFFTCCRLIRCEW